MIGMKIEGEGECVLKEDRGLCVGEGSGECVSYRRTGKCVLYMRTEECV